MGDENSLDEEFTLEDGAMKRRSSARRPNRFARRMTADVGPVTKPVEHSGLRSWVDKLVAGFRSLERFLNPGNEVHHHPSSLRIDVPLLLIVSTLVIFGLLMVYSASWKFSLADYSNPPEAATSKVFVGSPTTIFFRQLGFTILAIGVGVFLTFFNYHYLQRLVLPALLGTIVLLILVLFIHDERHGAIRSLFQGSIQPSEVAKLVIIMYLSVWLFNRRDQLHDMGLGLIPMSIIIGGLAGLILLQPDFSAMITVFLLGGMLFFLAGGDLKQIAFVMVLSGLIGWLIVRSNVVPTASERVNLFLAGMKNPLDASDHVRYSWEAFIKGGLFGVGIGKADLKLTILPFPHTDSIFAVIGQETGIVGSVFLITLFGLLLWRSLVISRRAPDGLGRLLAAGLGFWIVMEGLINMAVMVGLMPFAGNALPFTSAGGSNRLVSLAAIGIMMNISRLSAASREDKERSYGTVVNLRRRDWRRSVPRTRRPASSAKE